MMSSTGEPEYGQSTPDAAAALFGSPATDRSTYICAAVAAARVWGSNRYFGADATAGLAAASYDRGHSPRSYRSTTRRAAGNRVARKRTTRAQGAHPGHPRPGRHPRHAERRTTNGLTDLGLRTAARARHGPRPPGAPLAAPLRSHHRTYHPPSLTAQPRADAIEELGNRWVVMAGPEGNEFCVCDAGQHD
jgi:hypothetical protein